MLDLEIIPSGLVCKEAIRFPTQNAVLRSGYGYGSASAEKIEGSSILKSYQVPPVSSPSAQCKDERRPTLKLLGVIW